MYAILSGGALLSLCDKPRYIKQNKNGVYVEVDATEAIGVSVYGNLYNINGGNAIPDAPEAVIVQRDVSEYVFSNRVRLNKHEKFTNIAIIEVEDALCELDTAADEKINAMEDALCELDSIINGEGENNE